MKKKENDEIRITPDALISLVVTEAEERELASMPSLKEMNAQFHPSEQFQKKMDRLLKKAHRKEGWVQIWKPTKKVLIAFTSVMTALTFALTKITLQKALQALNELPEKYRITLVMKIKGYKLKDIACLTNTSEANVKNRIHRARKYIFSKLK